MSATVNIAGGVSARSGIMYALYGRGQQYIDNMKLGTNRAAAYASSMGSPEEFIAYAEEMAAAHGRKYETYNLVLAGDPTVFDVRDPEDIEKMLGLSVGLAEAAFSAEYLVVIHGDSKGEHAHGHIYVVNHDECTGKALKKNTSWMRGLRQLNDELLVEAGYDPNPDPARPRPDWELRREEFAPGGFEQTLGDLVYESLADPRCVDRLAFEQVLEENGVRFKVTDRDGWTYSMRRTDNGKWGRKKASALTPEFTAVGTQQIFDYHTQKGATHGVAGHDEAGRRAEVDYGDVGGVDLAAARRRAAALEADEDRGRPDGLREGDGRAAGGPVEAPVDLAAARAALDAAARRRDEKTLAAIASQLSSSEAVKLTDGSSVRRSDLDAHSMMTRIKKQLATTAQSSAELAEAVKKRGRVTIDVEKVNAHFAGQLDARLQRALEPSVARMEQTLAGFEARAAGVGTQRTAEAAQEVETVVAKADDVVATVEAAERRVATLESKVTWTAVGRLSLALLPLAAMLLVIGWLVGGIAYAAGFGPLLGWAWGSFTAAGSWWAKTLIALGTLGGLTGFGALVWWMDKRLGEDFRHW